jgi:two-component system chemotaxis response regulator CheB
VTVKLAEKIKVLVVDDSSFMRSILSRMISKDDRFEVVGQAKDGQEGVELSKTLKPDVITMDIEMPRMTGIEALKVIMKENPTPVVMVSSLTREGATSTLEAMDYGAVDFIPKAMDKGGDDSVLKKSTVLMDKLYAASKARMIRKFSRPPEVKRASIQEAVQSTDIHRTLPKSKLLNTKLLIIGSSTGGPRALQEVVPHLPANLKIPVVIAQHMPAHFTKPMAERLNQISAIKVVEGQDGDLLENGVVYIAPGGLHTRVKKEDGKLILSIKEDSGNECVYKPSVDILASSAADLFGGQVLALMLTGMGSDGAKGFEEIKNKGGYILAQDETTSVVYGMPKSVAPIADEILLLGDVIPVVNRLVS